MKVIAVCIVCIVAVVLGMALYINVEEALETYRAIGECRTAMIETGHSWDNVDKECNK